MANSLNPSRYISYLRSSAGTVATKLSFVEVEARKTTATVHREVLGLNIPIQMIKARVWDGIRVICFNTNKMKN